MIIALPRLSCSAPLIAPSLSVRLLRGGLASRAASLSLDSDSVTSDSSPPPSASPSSSSSRASPANIDSYAKWSDFTGISERTRKVVSTQLQFERMTEVQESVLTLLFGASDPGSKVAKNATVTVGLPELASAGWKRQEPPTQPPTLKVSKFLESLPPVPDLPNALGILEPDNRLHTSDLLVSSCYTHSYEVWS
ncbi:hypothetical protein BC830DRAFT_1105127 [Chytriomyces sp. MP71]|nr:hypothetical protein BC830DRAFT_1105127 [Chytriomyces sp. MP71]